MSTVNTALRILRHLDVSKLSPEAIEQFQKFEGGAEYVDGDLARDYIWTDEIVANTLEFVIADPDGEVLRAGFGSMIEAEQARAGAKVSFKLELAPTTDVTPRGSGRHSIDGTAAASA